MSSRSSADRYTYLRAACANRGLRLTPQREVLLRVLSQAMGHPTADAMVQRVQKVLPTVSHATVYRNLQELVREGVIRTLEVAGTAVQFELNPDDHHHFVCDRCGHVWDVIPVQPRCPDQPATDRDGWFPGQSPRRAVARRLRALPLIFVEVFERHVVFEHFSGANLPLTAIGVLDTGHHSRLEVLALLRQLLDAFEIGPIGIRQSLRIARLAG